MTAVVSAIGVNMTHGIMHQDADRILKNMCQKEATYINDMLNDVTKSVSIMEHYATTELKSVEALLDDDYRTEYINNVQILFDEIALNTKGLKTFYLRLNPEFSNNKAGFFKGVSRNGVIEEYVLNDFSLFSPDDEEHSAWYYNAVKAGKGVWIQPYNDYSLHEKMISYVTPFYSDGKLAGVIGIDIDFKYFVSYIDSIKVYKSGKALLVSADKKTVYNGSKDNYNEESANPHTDVSADLINGMTIKLAADYKDIQSDIHPMLFKIVGAFITVLIVFIIYTVIVTHRIVAPLKKLTAAAEDIFGGRETEEIEIKSKDEIGTLSKVLSSTYEKLREYTNYINILAYRDSLTGIKNRTAYAEAADNLDKRICCSNPAFAVIVADINNLKQTNDKYGHDIGNELIIHTTKILCEVFKNSPVFRIGGDEFVIILEGKDYENYRSLIEKIDDACSEDFISVDEERIPVSIARGVAVYNPNIDKVFEDVFNNADHAMYMHKQSMKGALV